MYRVTEVVKHLLIINFLVYLGSWLLGDPSSAVMERLVTHGNELNFDQWGRYRLAMFFPTSEYFKPYQVVTHMFMHGGLEHLIFNMFALFMFGPPLEAAWGARRFLTYYFLTGFGALALHLLVTYFQMQDPEMAWQLNVPMLGASGAVFGLLAGFGMLFPNARIMLLIPPIPMKAKYFVIIYAVIELILGVSNFNTGVAHFAHIGGALFGFLLILYWRRR